MYFLLQTAVSKHYAGYYTEPQLRVDARLNNSIKQEDKGCLCFVTSLYKPKDFYLCWLIDFELRNGVMWYLLESVATAKREWFYNCTLNVFDKSISEDKPYWRYPDTHWRIKDFVVAALNLYGKSWKSDCIEFSGDYCTLQFGERCETKQIALWDKKSVFEFVKLSMNSI